MGLFILHHYDPKNGWQESKVFEPDDTDDQNIKCDLLNEEIQRIKSLKYHEAHTDYLSGSTVEALAKYFKEKLSK